MIVPQVRIFGGSPFRAIFALIITFFAATAFGQDGESRERKVVSSKASIGSSRLEMDPIFPGTPVLNPAKTVAEFASPEMLRFKNSLLGAIDERLGAPYVYGATGPYSFDCSGFVWSAFQQAGIPFGRGSARTLWSEFLPAPENHKYKFGTLVFFSGLSHIGIVVDEKGFYHASRTHGVTYSPFNDYWLERVDGFREVTIKPTIASE